MAYTDNQKINNDIRNAILLLEEADESLWRAVSSLTDMGKLCIDKKTYRQSSTGAYAEAMARAVDSERSCILKLREALSRDLQSYSEDYFPVEEAEE